MLQSHSFTNTLVLRAPRTKRNDARERRRRERRKFGAPYASFTQKCLLHHCAWQKSKKNGVFPECSKVTHLQIRWFRARLRTKEKAMSRAPKARAEKNLCILRKFSAKVLSVPLLLAKSANKNGVFSKCSKVTHEYVGFARASGTKRKRCRERRRRERRKFGALYASFMQKCLLYHWTRKKC